MIAGILAGGHPAFGIPLPVILVLLVLAIILYWALRAKGL